MNRALYSGVAGLKAHQTRMDVIGNNISNVNTYGYKAQRVIFSDVFYQTVSSATAGTASSGGTNPSSVGYGSQLAAIQTQMSQSSLQSTGYGMDVAITGEGFFQVMDPDGNIFYTKAGILNYDSNGYLTDVNGNFVLGSAKADGVPASQKIKIDDLGSVPSKQSSVEATINNVKYSLKAANVTDKGNVSINIGSSDVLPVGKNYEVTISSTGAINVLLNSSATFTLTDLNNAINNGITAANGNKPHEAGNFTLTASPDNFGTGLTGAQIAGNNFGVNTGTITGMTTGAFGGAMTFEKVSSGFTGSGVVTFAANNPQATYTPAAAPAPAFWTITMTAGGKTYTGKINSTDTSSSLLLKNAGSDTDYIQVKNPGFATLTTQADVDSDGIEVAEYNLNGYIPATVPPAGNATPSTASKDLGLSSTSFALAGGTKGGQVTLDQLTSIAIGSDGVISVTQSDMGTVAAGKISLANFANPSGLQLEGTDYFSATANSGKAILCNPGSNGTGGLKSNALEMSNVDLSSEFAEMITTQRGFQANSRIITVSDTMLEELINLKR